MVANQYLRKGSKILVEGRLNFEQWVDQNGGKRSKHSVIVETMQMLDSKGDNQGGGGYNAPQNTPVGNENQGYNAPNQGQAQSYQKPQQQQQSYQQPQQQQQQPSYNNNQAQTQSREMPSSNSVPVIDIDEDEIPF